MIFKYPAYQIPWCRSVGRRCVGVHRSRARAHWTLAETHACLKSLEAILVSGTSRVDKGCAGAESQVEVPTVEVISAGGKTGVQLQFADGRLRDTGLSRGDFWLLADQADLLTLLAKSGVRK